MKIEVYTTGYEGYIEKTANVYTNDPAWNMVVLTIKAQIKPAISISAPLLILSGKQGEIVKGEVEVRANLERVLILKPDIFNLAEKITYTLVESEKGKKFIVRFKSIHGLTESIHGFLKLHTNYPEKPEIAIYLRCDLVP